MTITVNGAPRQVSDGTTVALLVGELNRDGRGVAVAVNSEVVSRSQWAVRRLAAGDRVEVLGAAQGG